MVTGILLGRREGRQSVGAEHPEQLASVLVDQLVSCLLRVPVGVPHGLLKGVDDHEDRLKFGMIPDGRSDADPDRQTGCKWNDDWHKFSLNEEVQVSYTPPLRLRIMTMSKNDISP
ncbi:MAG: hypothetical protein JNM56_10275 [Planctomycetia bacterium]|nr:hypothetical protein [Planctomycetia bacterium]